MIVTLTTLTFDGDTLLDKCQQLMDVEPDAPDVPTLPGVTEEWGYEDPIYQRTVDRMFIWQEGNPYGLDES